MKFKIVKRFCLNIRVGRGIAKSWRVDKDLYLTHNGWIYLKGRGTTVCSVRVRGNLHMS